MRLTTLGHLRLEGIRFFRVKPLLMSAYLALEGRTPRHFLADLFFSDAKDARDSLSSALGHLRKVGVPLEQDSEMVSVTLGYEALECDAVDFEAAVKMGNHADIKQIYQGPFASGLDIPLGTELEEWFYRTRERLAHTRREVYLRDAEEWAARGEFEKAGYEAVGALELVHTPPLEEMGTKRLYTLLRAAQHPFAARVAQESLGLGLIFDLSTQQAQHVLRRPLLGRERECQLLEELRPGEWAWVRGAQGMGKTALLEQLAGVHLPAREGRLASLGPLLLGETQQDRQLERLAAAQTLLIEDWEGVDTESRRLLLRLRQGRFAVRVVITSRRAPAFAVERLLELQPLTPEALSEYPLLYEKTEGLPSLVAAVLGGESLEGVFSKAMAAFSPLEREVYAALALCSNLTVVSKGLGLNPDVFSQTLERWLESGWVVLENSEQARVRVRDTALIYLQSQSETEWIALTLARVSSGDHALDLYKRARLRWEEPDTLRLVRLSLETAQNALAQGQPHQALSALEYIPATPYVLAMRARALERVGQYPQAARLLGLLELPVLALRATVAYRQGQTEQANQYAQAALLGSIIERAEGQQVLGNLHLDAGQLEAAIPFLRAAAALYLLEGDLSRRGEALISLVIVRSELGEDAEKAFWEALEASENDSILRTRVLINLGKVYEHRNDPDAAEGFYKLALEKATLTGALDSIAKIWNNLGTLHHQAGHIPEANSAYRQALVAAQTSRELLVQATVLGNLGMLHHDPIAMEEAIRILEDMGQTSVAERQRVALSALRQDLASNRTRT
jgi:tetratricopeptide (TPR) repeat protein